MWFWQSYILLFLLCCMVRKKHTWWQPLIKNKQKNKTKQSINCFTGELLWKTGSSLWGLELIHQFACGRFEALFHLIIIRRSLWVYFSLLSSCFTNYRVLTNTSIHCVFHIICITDLSYPYPGIAVFMSCAASVSLAHTGSGYVLF